jgi:hypothetical protein
MVALSLRRGRLNRAFETAPAKRKDTIGEDAIYRVSTVLVKCKK